MDQFERLFERFVTEARKDYPDIDGSFTGENAMNYDHMNGFTGPADLTEAIEETIEMWFADNCTLLARGTGDCNCPNPDMINSIAAMVAEVVESFDEDEKIEELKQWASSTKAKGSSPATDPSV